MGVDFRRFDQFVRTFKTSIRREIEVGLNKAGQSARDFIITRTRRGEGLNGTFARYTPEYRDFRNKNGRGAKPDLNFSGRMLSSIDVHQNRSTSSVIVYFKRREEEKKAIKNEVKRPFFGLKSGEIRTIGNDFATHLRNRL